jgi:CheY-like chemotaxis protein
VLVIDLHLPDIDGHELLRTLRRLPALHDVPAFLCSADDSAELRDAAASAGFAGCWNKPVDRRTLQRELAALGIAGQPD